MWGIMTKIIYLHIKGMQHKWVLWWQGAIFAYEKDAQRHWLTEGFSCERGDLTTTNKRGKKRQIDPKAIYIFSKQTQSTVEKYITKYVFFHVKGWRGHQHSISNKSCMFFVVLCCTELFLSSNFVKLYPCWCLDIWHYKYILFLRDFMWN